MTPTAPTPPTEDQNGHKIDAHGKLVHDERCQGCDAPATPEQPGLLSDSEVRKINSRAGTALEDGDAVMPLEDVLYLLRDRAALAAKLATQDQWMREAREKLDAIVNVHIPAHRAVTQEEHEMKDLARILLVRFPHPHDE